MANKFLQYFFLTHLSVIALYSQQSSTGVTNFYPLEVGNYWEYFVDGWMGVREDTTKSYVESDTLISGFTYMILKSSSSKSYQPTYYTYQRIDSTGNLYTFDPSTNEETLTYRFSDTSKTYWPYDTFIAQFDTLLRDNIFSNERKILRINFYSPSDSTTAAFVREFAEGIGLVRDYTSHQQGAYLNAATIGDTTFGSIVLAVGDDAVPSGFHLYQNFPNPFNPSTVIRFSIPRHTIATLKIFDLHGREIATLLTDEFQPGEYSVTWNAARIASGVYFYQFQSGQYRETKPMVLIK